MEFLNDVLKDKCLSCDVCCRFPEKYSNFIPYFLNSEIRDPEYFDCVSSNYGCRINAVKHDHGYRCPYFSPKENKCVIYSERPLDCKIYPFMVTYNEDYSKVILVLDKNCPHAEKLLSCKHKAIEFVNSIKISDNNIGFINDYIPDTFFVSELWDFKGLKKLSVPNPVSLYLWKDIMNIFRKEEEGVVSFYYKTGDSYKRIETLKEYIYRRGDLIGLKGDNYRDKRNLCNFFEKKYNYVVEELLPSDDVVSECILLYKKWADDKKEKGKDIVGNRHAYSLQLIEDSLFFHKRALLDFNKIGLSGLIVRSGGKMIGYTFGCEVKPDTFCVLGEITERGYKGISQFIFREFCKRLPENYVYVNTMDDSDIEGLRKNKMSYKPIL